MYLHLHGLVVIAALLPSPSASYQSAQDLETLNSIHQVPALVTPPCGGLRRIFLTLLPWTSTPCISYKSSECEWSWFIYFEFVKADWRDKPGFLWQSMASRLCKVTLQAWKMSLKQSSSLLTGVYKQTRKLPTPSYHHARTRVYIRRGLGRLLPLFRMRDWWEDI